MPFVLIGALKGGALDVDPGSLLLGSILRAVLRNLLYKLRE